MELYLEQLPYRTFEDLKGGAPTKEYGEALWAAMHLLDVTMFSERGDEYWENQDFDLNSQYISNKNIRDGFYLNAVMSDEGPLGVKAVGEIAGCRVDITPVLQETSTVCYLRNTAERNPEAWRKEGWVVFEDFGEHYIRTMAYAKKRWCFNVVVYDGKAGDKILFETTLQRRKVMDYLYEVKDEIKKMQEEKDYDRAGNNDVESIDNEL